MSNINRISDKVAVVNGHIHSVDEISANNTSRIESMVSNFTRTSDQVDSLDKVINRF